MAASKKKSLVVVESPSKARTIERYLGENYKVLSTVGHIRDLPTNKLGVDVEKDFAPTYEIISGKAKVIDQVKRAAAQSDRVFLAPDPDREGEAIAWHIAAEIGGRNENLFRVKFNEITKSAIREAIANPGEIDNRLVNAQQARRVLDRLVGYQISPLLWQKVQKGLSAGRVQSVAVRMIVDREREIDAFVPKEYWSIEALVEKEGEPPAFVMKLAAIDGKKFEIGTEAAAKAVVDEVKGERFTVGKLTSKEVQRRPYPPFITSTLQQEAVRKLGLTTRMTMRVAQQLYEGIEIGEQGPTGLITYMRTDSTRIAKQAQDAARAHIARAFSPDYVPPTPNEYPSKAGAQDAHEAIRPTSMDLPPEAVEKSLTKEQLKLYRIIWNRFLASQMAPARIEQTRVESYLKDRKYTFAASGSVVLFPGFLAAYEETKEETKEEKPEDGENGESKLPRLAEGDPLKRKWLKPLQHFTQPPPRYTESSLVKELEAQGIGRPSTYAAIIQTILDREYVVRDKRRFKPTERGVIVTDLLVRHFPEIMDVKFTALMEDQLDHVEDGKVEWVSLLRNFYGPFQQRLEAAASDMPNVKPEVVETDVVCDKCGAKMVLRWGKNGRFLACSAFPKCRNTKPYESDEEGKIRAVEAEPTGETCEKCGAPMVLRTGRNGRFLACSAYPKCRNTKPYESDEEGKIRAVEAEPTGETCEKCGAPMVVRTGRMGRFLACSAYPKCRNTKPLAGDERGPARAAPVEETNETCEKCGAKMVIRAGRMGRFLACSAYPKCKNTRPAPIGVKCPREGCEGQLVERMSKRGKPFYACNQYPKCKFAVFERPRIEHCDTCNEAKQVVGQVGKTKVFACSKAECPYENVAAEAKE